MACAARVAVLAVGAVEAKAALSAAAGCSGAGVVAGLAGAAGAAHAGRAGAAVWGRVEVVQSVGRFVLDHSRVLRRAACVQQIQQGERHHTGHSSSRSSQTWQIDL